MGTELHWKLSTPQEFQSPRVSTHSHTHTKITMINTTTCHQSFSSHSKTGQNFRHNQHMLRTNTSLTYIKWFNFDNILTEGQIIVQHLPWECLQSFMIFKFYWIWPNKKLYMCTVQSSGFIIMVIWLYIHYITGKHEHISRLALIQQWIDRQKKTWS